MRWVWLLACGGLAASGCTGTEDRPEEARAPKSAAARPTVGGGEEDRQTLDLLEGEILKIKPHYTLVDPETGKKYIYRIYTEHHPGADYEIAIVTVPHGASERLANWPEIQRATELKEAELRTRGAKIDRVLELLYAAERRRAEDGLDEHIRYTRAALEELSSEMDRLARQIQAEREVPPVDDRRIAYWTEQMLERAARRRELLRRLQILLYHKRIRDRN